MPQLKRMDSRSRPLPDDQVHAKIFHRRIQHFLHGRLQAVNFIKKEDFLFFERGQDRGQVAFAFQQRSRTGLDRHVQFVGDNLCQSGLSETRRSIEQRVVQRFVAAASRVDCNLNVFFDAFLSDVFVQALWPHAHIEPRVFVKRLPGHNPLWLSLRHHAFCRSIRHSSLPARSPNPESALVGAQHAAYLQPRLQRTTPRAHCVLLARSTLVVRRATTSQNFQRPLRASHLRPRLLQHARRIRDSPAPKRHRPRFPRAKTPPASPSPQSRFPVCPSTPPPCVPPFCVPRLEFSLAAPDRSHESPARVPRRSSRSKSSAPEPAPRRKPKAASQKNAFPARRQTRTAPAHLPAHGCGSGGSLRCAARRARRRSKAAPARGTPRRPRPRALGSVFFRRAVREAGQSSFASIAAFPSPVNAHSTVNDRICTH